jgi:putative endonuclease
MEKAQAAHISIGKLGEQIATIYLQKRGYKIMARNFRCKSGEIDIIAKSPHGCTSFVEVKCRVGDAYGKPYESVTWSKQKKMHSAIQFYMLQNYLQDSKLKVEVISIILNPDRSISDIKHFDDL